MINKEVVKFLDDVHKTLMDDVLGEADKRHSKVVNFEHPEDLKVIKLYINKSINLKGISLLGE